MSASVSMTRRQLVRSAVGAAVALPLAGAGAMAGEPQKRGIYVSVRDEMLASAGFNTTLEGLRYCGLSAVEIAVNRDSSVRAISPPDNTDKQRRLRLNDDADVKVLADQLAATNTRLSAFLLPNNFNAPDIDAELAWVVRVVEVAGRLGVPAVRIDAIMHGADAMPVKDREAIFARGVHFVLDHTKGLKVDLGIENHGTQGNNPDFLEGLRHLVRSPRLGYTMDMGNLYWAGYPLDTVYDILKRLAPYTKHTHVKNIRYPAEIRNTRRQPGYEYGKYCCPIPEGDIDIRKVVSFLKVAHYTRDLCIEDESIGKFAPAQRKENLRAAAQYLQGIV